ncbi:hypothetical protein BC936DRAFT_139692 [Jimgerdemannia flammicorona]|uniref:Uncharacterized protein n=1 Tax=Jimgerdemannia flammicorona TaxID=994334 RepID=A0A433B9F4_9FUNG|nr:hypothetical protein BC936DRAFT_139692 [Jimgerdemannia flammicorona]
MLDYILNISLICGLDMIAVKQATSFFVLNNPDMTQREKELIKSVAELDAIAVMLGKVKVSAPNLEASKRAGKKK